MQDICSRTDDDCRLSGANAIALDVISIIGVTLSIIGLVLTVITMLAFKYVCVCTCHMDHDFTTIIVSLIDYKYTQTFLHFINRKVRNKDISKFHTQLSLALLGMLLVFVTGIDRTEELEACVTVSVLIHYFTLSAVMWMGAEALVMYQKLVRVFVHTTTRQIVIISLVCWCK